MIQFMGYVWTARWDILTKGDYVLMLTAWPEMEIYAPSANPILSDNLVDCATSATPTAHKPPLSTASPANQVTIATQAYVFNSHPTACQLTQMVVVQLASKNINYTVCPV